MALQGQGTALRHHLFPLGGYLLLTLALTYPLLRHFSTSLPGDFTDGWQNYWNYWWVREALAQWRNPFQTPLLYAPDGAPLYVHTLNLFSGLATLPIQWAFGLVAAYNAVVLLSFTLAGYFTYLVVALETGHRWAGFAGGAIYAFGSYQLMQLVLEHANLYASEWLPAYVLCLIVAGRQSGWRRAAVVAGGATAIVFLMLCDWQYAIFAAGFTGLYSGYHALQRRTWRPLIDAGSMGLLAGLLALPVLIPALRQVNSGNTVVQFEYFPENFSADLLAFVTPSPLSLVGRRLFQATAPAFVAPANEKAIFLGYLPLGLAAFGCRRRWAQSRFWLLAAAAFGVLALGPILQVGGHALLLPGGHPIPLPYRLVQIVPGVNVSRVPVRFTLIAVLCLAVLAGFGVAEFGRWRLLVRRPGLRAAMAVGLVALIVLEQSVVPLPLKQGVPPAFYRSLAASPEQGTILEWPLSLKRARSLYYQTIHDRPLVGGYLSRPLVYPLLLLPPYREQYYPADDIVLADSAAAGRWALHYAQVHWIVVLRDDPTLSERALPNFLQRYAESEPIYADAQMTVYRPLPPEAVTFYIGVEGLNQGWYGQEMLADGHTIMRWLRTTGTLTAWNLTETAQQGELQFEAWSFYSPRRVEVTVDGRVIGQMTVSERRRYTLSLTLEPGQHRVIVRSLDPPMVPASVGQGSDPRAVAIGVANVDLRPR